MTGQQIGFPELLARIGYTTDDPRGSAERISICQQQPGWECFRGQVRVWSTVVGVASRLIDDSWWNLWFSVNALGEVPRGRGKESDVIRLAALIADLDFKKGGCGDLVTAYAIIAAISEALGEDPVAITHSGHGLQPYWAVEVASALGLTNTEAKRLLDRFKALVQKVAADHGCGVDAVFDLARVLRLPGSVNYKDPENPVPVRCFAGDGRPLTVDQVTAALDAAGIPEDPMNRARKKQPRTEKKPKDKPPRGEKKAKAKPRGGDKPPLYAVIAAMTPGKPSPKVRARLGDALTDMTTGIDRHHKTRDHALALLRYGYNGETGVDEALTALHRAFVNAVADDRIGGRDEADSEFTSFVVGAEDIISADPPVVTTVWTKPSKRRKRSLRGTGRRS